MKYTKKQRREIYLKAAERIEKNDSSTCCWAIQSIIKPKNTYCTSITENITSQFEEFKLFENKDFIYWFGWPSCSISRQERVTCLLLCAEMCR